MKSAAIAFAFVVFLFPVAAAPLPVVELPSVKGTVVAFTWGGGFHCEQKDVWQGVNPVGMREAVPTCFLLLHKTNLSEK